MTYGTYGVARGMSPSTRLTVHAFWDYLAFAMNSVVFLLVGFTVQLSLLRAHWRAVLLSFLVVAIARAATVYATTLALRRTRERMPWSWPALLSWGGLRGALSMVLVLGLPEDLPLREQLVAMTFGAVLLSIVLQGMTVAPLLRRLGLSREEAGPSEHEQLRATQGSARAALAALARLEAEGAHDAAALEAVKKGYTEKLREAEESARSLPEEAHEPSKRELARALLLVEKDHLRRRHHEGQLSAQGLEAMEARLDEALLALEEE